MIASGGGIHKTQARAKRMLRSRTSLAELSRVRIAEMRWEILEG